MSTDTHNLYLHEQVFLLSLNDDGYVNGWTKSWRIAVVAAALVDLFLAKRISFSKNMKVAHSYDRPIDSKLLEKCRILIRSAWVKRTLQGWVDELFCIAALRRKIAKRMCGKGLISKRRSGLADIFVAKYSIINPVPKEQLIERLHRAVHSTEALDTSDCLLISLVAQTGILDLHLGERELHDNSRRIEQIVQGKALNEASMEFGEIVRTVDEAIFELITRVDTSGGGGAGGGG